MRHVYIIYKLTGCLQGRLHEKPGQDAGYRRNDGNDSFQGAEANYQQERLQGES